MTDMYRLPRIEVEEVEVKDFLQGLNIKRKRDEDEKIKAANELFLQRRGFKKSGEVD